MLDTDPAAMRQEVEAAIQLRRMHTEVSSDLIRMYAGNYYREDWNPDSPIPENHFWEFAANVMPNLVYTNPKVRVKSRKPVAQAEITDSMRRGINRWVTDVSLDRVLTKIALDLLFDFGVGLTTLEPVPGYNGWRGFKPLWPRMTRISPRRFFIDSQATSIEAARLMGHKWVRDRDALLKARDKNGKPKYDRQAIQALAIVDAKEDLVEGAYGDSQLHAAKNYPLRNQVTGYEIYVPEERKIYTLAGNPRDAGAQTVFLREPRDYFGPPWGPYTLFGIYIVPDQVYPLSPLAASAEQVEELNAHASAASRAAAREKSLVLVDSSNDSVGRAVKDGVDGSVYKVTGLTGAHAEVQLGGVTPDRLNYIGILRDRLDRNSGLSDVQRGNITGQATATEITKATAASDTRSRFMRREFHFHTIQVLRTAGWYMFSSPSVVFPVPGGDERNPKDATFVGGVADGLAGVLDPAQADASFDDLELEIEPYSMEYVDQELLQKRAQDAVELISGIAPVMPELPWVAWRELMDYWGEMQNNQEFSRFINFDVLEQMTQVAIARMQDPEALESPVEAIERFKERNPRPVQRPAGLIGQGGRNATPGAGVGALASQVGALQAEVA